MNLEEVIKNRKSVRFFKQQAIEEEKIKKIITLVNLAPSAGNLQAYKIFVIKDQEKINRLSKIAYGMSHFQNLPPLVFVFCADPHQSGQHYGKRGEKIYSLQDATIACAYAQLIITDLGLSSCWVGGFEEKELQQFLKTHLLPVAILTIGYPGENPARHPRKSLQEIYEEIK